MSLLNDRHELEVIRLRQEIDQLKAEKVVNDAYIKQMKGVWAFIEASLQQVESATGIVSGIDFDAEGPDVRMIIGFLTAMRGMLEPLID